jgi:pterin-4a-carbinolamine dehydratase
MVLMIRWHRPLMLFAGAMALLTVATAAAWLVDDRLVMGAPVWAKPLKFAISFTLYALTWAWLLSLRQRARRWAHRAGTALVVAGSVEVALITFQAARGRRSHFNLATELDALIFVVMGVTIVALFAANVVAAAAVLLDRQADRPAAWTVRLGLAISTAGLALGGLMLGPRPDQDRARGIIGAHTIASPDGGPGLPLLGWSTVGGDLRAPHFIGMHALQLLPLLGFALAALARRLPALRPEVVRTRLILVAGGMYAGVLAITVWQALRGQPVIHPDAATLGALAALLAAGLAGALVSLRPPAKTVRHPLPMGTR